MISLDQAKGLQYGDTVYHSIQRYSDGSPCRWVVNGGVKTWRMQANRVKVPIKFGLHSFSYLTENNLPLFCMTAMEVSR